MPVEPLGRSGPLEISGEKVGLFTGNSWNAGTDYAKARVTVTNCYNHAEMYGLVSCSAFASNNKPTDLGYTDEQKSYNEDVSAINVDGGSMEIVDALAGLALVKGTDDADNAVVKIVPSTSNEVASYEIRVFAQNSFKRANETNAGSSYVMLRVTGDENITLPLISEMVSSASANPTVNFDGVTDREIYSNSRYVLVDNEDGSKTMYVHAQDMLDNFGDGAASVTLNSATRYTVYAKDAEGRIIGAATYWYKNLPVAETESEIEEEGTSVEETTNIEGTPNTEESEA